MQHTHLSHTSAPSFSHSLGFDIVLCFVLAGNPGKGNPEVKAAAGSWQAAVREVPPVSGVDFLLAPCRLEGAAQGQLAMAM